MYKRQGVGEIVGGALTAVYAKNLILKKAGLEETFLKEQVKISLAASDFSEKNIIDLKVLSRIRLPVPGYRLRRLKFLERGRVRAWTGRSPSEEMAEGEETEGETVYVALNGSVYHRDPDCSYIKVSIKSASVAEMERKRSSDGSKYYPCSCYGPKTGSTQPKLSAACFVVQSCLADADFVVFSNYCLIGTRLSAALLF